MNFESKNSFNRDPATLAGSLKAACRDNAFRLGNALFPPKKGGSGLIASVRRSASFMIRDAFILSYPKSGRTWMRTMIGRVIESQFGLDLVNPMEVQHFWKAASTVPCIGFVHDGEPNLSLPEKMESNKKRFRRKKILFLVRDPRDIVVSYYFDARYRMKIIDCEMRDFIFEGAGSIQSVIAYYNVWARERHKVKAFNILSYEDMRADPTSSLLTALDYLGVEGVPEHVVAEAVEFASFSNLKKLEATNSFNHERLQPRDSKNPDSFKVRRGKVGGYTDYLSPQEIGRIDDFIRQNLDPFFSRYFEAGGR